MGFSVELSRSVIAIQCDFFFNISKLQSWINKAKKKEKTVHIADVANISEVVGNLTGVNPTNYLFFPFSDLCC